MAAPAKLAIDVIYNGKAATKGLKDTAQDIEKLEDTTKKSSSGMSSALAGFAGGAAFGAFSAGLGALKTFVSGTVTAASDLNETTAQTGQIFGDAAADIERFAASSATAIGLSTRAAMDAANTFATFGKAAGLTGSNLSKFSTDMVTLSGDLASFKNTTPEESIEAIGAALRGEAEPIRKYGVMLDDATLKNRALALGLIKTTKDALTPQQKALAAQAEILAQTADAQGDFARTSDGLANQQRIIAAQFENMQAELGQALLPVLTAVGLFITSTLVPALKDMGRFIGDNIGVIGAITAAIGLFVLAVQASAISTKIAATATKIWTGAQAAFNAVMTANPVFLVLAALVALGAAIYLLWNNSETFRTTVTALWESFKVGAEIAFDAVRSAVKSVGDAFTRLWENVLKPVFDAAAGAVSVWWQVNRKMFELVAAAARVVGAAFVWLWENAIHPALGFIVEMIDALWAAAQPVFSLLADAARVVGQVFVWLWDTAAGPALGFLAGQLDLLWQGALVWADIIATAARAVGAVFSWLWDSAAGPALGFLTDAVAYWWQGTKQSFGLIADAARLLGSVFVWLYDNVVKPVFGFLTDTTRRWVDTVKVAVDVVVGFWRGFATFFGETAGRIAAVGSTMWNWVAGGVAGVWSLVTGTWNDIVGFIGGIAGRIAFAARGMWDGVLAAFRSALNTIIRGWNALEFTIPSVTIFGVGYPDFTLGVPDIPYLAAGGVINRPTVALVGEAGQEIVAPTKLLRKLMAETSTSSGTTVVNNFAVTVTHTGLGADSPTIQRDVVEAMRGWQARNGPVTVGG